VPVDIDLETLAPTPDVVRAAITSKTILYLHAHLYGSRNALTPFAVICRARGVLLVEDCAQAYDGRAFLGSPGADVSLFSFGPIKPATTLGGAVARIRDPHLRAKVEAEMSNWLEQPSRAISRRARKLMMLKAMSGPRRYAGVLAAMKLRRINADAAIGAAARGFRPGDLIAQISHRPSARLLALMARRLSRAPRAGWRRDNALRLRAALRRDVFIPGGRTSDHAYWLFPILVADPQAVIDALRREGFDATRGATSMRVIAGGATPNARRLIDSVVYLPLSPNLHARDIARMAHAVNLAAPPHATGAAA
jgi:dTDP-4-amino-4,6-dideoxygalactose transaminase